MRLSAVLLVLSIGVDWSCAFQLHRAQNEVSLSSTALRQQHQFNGGYDASDVTSSAKWAPKEAAEFVIWHMSTNFEETGRQLTPLIQHWNGKDLGEFLSRLYLGETTDDFEISYESRNVRTPQWKGLDVEGLTALKELLRTALPDGLLTEPIEMANVAEAFLWQERSCPETNVETGKLEQESFASLGYTPAIVNMWLELREERGAKRNFQYSADDVLEMVPAPSKEWGALQLFGMQQFFYHIGIRLAPSCKVKLVQGMACSGWNPGKIAKFVSAIPEISEEEKKTIAPEVTAREAVKPVVKKPMQKSLADSVDSFTKFVKESQGEVKPNTDDKKNDKIELNAEIPGVVQDFLAPKNDALDAVRRRIQKSKRTAPWQ